MQLACSSYPEYRLAADAGDADPDFGACPASHRNPVNGDCTVAAFTLSTALVGMLCVIWGCWMHVRLRGCASVARWTSLRAEVAQNFREALLEGAAQGVMVLRSGDQERQYFGDGKRALRNLHGESTGGQGHSCHRCSGRGRRAFALSVRSDMAA